MQETRAGAVAISTGFYKTHVTTAAREASDRSLLKLAITSVYPTRRVRRALQLLRLSDRGRLARLLERDEDIPADRVDALFMPELLGEAARLLTRVPFARRLYPTLLTASMRLYGRLAGRKLRKGARGAGIYHFRAGFGHGSLQVARELGLYILCDHAIAHPSVLDELVANRGELSHAQRAGASSARPGDPAERAILADINDSDAVLVNSDFVKETFLALGWQADRVHVVYLGVDDGFLNEMPTDGPQRPGVADGRLRLLYAGRLERRKGAETLIEALEGLRDVDWELVIAGPVVPDVWSEYRGFLESDRVTLLGTLRRPDLMRLMMSVPVFVFPSFAEGSARVVFEALACGAYVITTPNAGSIVEDGVHGAIVPPGDAEKLTEAIVHAEENRRLVAEIGARNAELVAQRFRQTDYGAALAALYDEILTERT